MAYQSLYRRYRSQTFAEVLGQDHVTRALRNAVREGRVTQGYLFSGPRGTGKTSSARILAKVLNCENPSDGEPCTECANCIAVQEGRPVDWLQELDAASNNGVDAIRDLLGRVSMGTSGNRKVYILDEVHMLSKPASNALLKTLEEPPAHVVFVLATTEPEKVLPTIRSRTQHYDFNLLPAETLADHVRYVIADAGLDLGEDAVEHVVAAGGGSARDTLSALDQVAAAGGVSHSGIPVDEIVDALGARDVGAALLAVDAAVRSGRDPRVIAETLVDALRNAFLVAMGAPGGGLSDRAQTRAGAVAEALGPATLTRSLEALGTALVDMRQAPDPRIPLEVALVRLTRPQADVDLSALTSRIEALERALAAGTPVAPPPASTPADAPATSPTPADPATAPSGAAPAPATAAPASPGSRPRGAEAARAKLSQHGATAPEAPAPTSDSPVGSRPSLGGVQRARQGEAVPGPAPVDPAPSPAAPAPDTAGASTATPAPAAPVVAEPTAGPPSVDELTAAWEAVVLESLKPRAKALYKPGRFVAGDDRVVRFALPNQAHLEHCADKVAEVAEALGQHFGRPVVVELVVADGGGTPTASSPVPGATAAPAPDADPRDDAVDLDELTDAPDPSTGGIAQLQDAFPGAELLEDS